MQHIDRQKHPPTSIGAHGEAWEVDLDKSRAACGLDASKDATVAMWLFYCPWAHSLWSYYLLGAIHLRPLPGFQPAKINLPGATHEVILFALDPDVVPDPVNTARNQKLTPANFIGQWIVRERPNPVDLDRGAAAKVRITVAEILSGILSPDTDFRREWIRRFSNSNILR